MLKASDFPTPRVNPAIPFVAAVPAYEFVDTGPVLDWGWIKITKELHNRYGASETRIELKLPLRKREFFDHAWDAFSFGRPALFVAFGKIPLAPHGWHARGAMIYVDVEHRNYR